MEKNEKYKKGDKVRITLVDKKGWVAGEFEVADVVVEREEVLKLEVRKLELEVELEKLKHKEYWQPRIEVKGNLN